MVFKSDDDSFGFEYAKLLLSQEEWVRTLIGMKEHYTVEAEKNIWSLQIDDWKWYDTYTEIKAFESLWQHFAELEEEHEKLHGAFVRIGEDEADIETRYINEGYELAQAHSEIETYFD